MITPRVNPRMKLTWAAPFLIVDDFLENLDEFRKQLWDRGEFTHARTGAAVPDVGPAHDWRQIVPPAELPEEFRQAIMRLQMLKIDAGTKYNTNRLYSDMKVETRRARATYYPHSDFRAGFDAEIPIVFNLWLHDGGGGTGFYSYDGYHSSSAMPPELLHFVENYIDGTEEGFARGAIHQSYNSFFRGNAEWQLWHLAEMKKNRAFVYCGDLWHRVLIPPGEFAYPDARFSFVAFSGAGSPDFLAASGSRPYLEAPGPL